jgi:glycosyltransferase involved in cell wall biosynthesis
LGIHQKVHFAGYRRDAAKILESLDLYVQPSRFEGMSLAVLEAMAAGLPVVASAVDGNCELIQDGVSGWLVPPEDSKALSAAIKSALADPIGGQQRGKAAQRAAQDQFSVGAMVDAWEALLARGAAA